MDEQRAEFEAWASHFFTRGELDRHGINGARPDEYRVLHIERMWGAWQAATQRQQERIAELEADVAHKDAYAEQLGTLLFKAGAERQELEAQVQALSLDAGRLDWLATQEGSYRGIDGDLPDLPFWEVCGVEGQNVREAIDAAIAAGKGEA